MNKVVLQGNLASDPVSKQVGQTSVTTFTIAVSEGYKKANGEFAEDTQFIDCEAWDSGGKSIADKWSKGDPVLVEGKLKKDVWEKDGAKHSRTKVRVSNFKRFARFQKQEAQDSQVTEPVAVSGGEDIPF
jgi:single-strand DNA-binding protein